MEIKVTYGVGEGSTELAAFDKALFDAGIANYNLIKLSSVIPPNSSIKTGKLDWNEREHGDRLYVVLSNQEESTPGKEAWAGLGWVIARNDSGKGLFVEHHGNSRKQVTSLINKSLSSMVKYRKEEYGPVLMSVQGITCKKNPVCALVCAVYKNEGWS